MNTQTIKQALDRVTQIQLFLGLGALSLVVMVVGTCMMFDTSGPLPPPRDPPPRVETSAVLSYRYKEGFFKALVKEDVTKLHLSFDFDGIKRPNRHFVEFSGNQVLRPGNDLETRHLLLQVLQQKIWVGEEVGQGFRSDHLVLGITNKTHRYLAYRVFTSVAGACHGKGTVAHNALAIRPKERLMRTECLLRSGGTLKVNEVEVMELTPLGYYYVSRLDPGQIRLSQRGADGHEIPKGLATCRMLPWREIQHGMRRGDLHWRDVIDFYSRHNCDEYTFFPSYRYSEKGLPRLPVVPPS